MPERPDSTTVDHRIAGLTTLFALLYFVQGISEPTEGLIAQPTRSLLRNWGHPTEDITAFMALLALPWAIKPVYGLLTDFVPLAGTRRRSWLLITTSATSLGLIGLYLFAPERGMAGPLLVWLLVPTVGVAFSDVVVDALMVEEGQPRGLTGRLQSVQWAAIWTATIVVGFVGGWLSQQNLQPIGFLLAGLITSGSFLVAFLVVREPRIDSLPPAPQSHSSLPLASQSCSSLPPAPQSHSSHPPAPQSDSSLPLASQSRSSLPLPLREDRGEGKLATSDATSPPLVSRSEGPAPASRISLSAEPGAWRGLSRSLWHPGITAIAAFLFLWSFNPFSASVLNEHMVRRMGFSEQFYGITISLQAVGSVLGSLAYAVYCRRLGVGQLVHLSIVTGILATVAYWGMVGVWSAALVSVSVGFVYMTGTIIQLDLAARTCEAATAGTTFSLLMALTNLAAAGSTAVGGWAYARLAEAAGFDWAFRILVGVGAAATSLCWLLLPSIRRHCSRPL